MGDEERRDKGILMLGDDNFDAWERAVGDALYGAGAYELVEVVTFRRIERTRRWFRRRSSAPNTHIE